MSMLLEGIILGVLKVAAVSYLVHCNTLLVNATDLITKCNSYFITKCDVIKNPTTLLATVTTKCI